MTDQQCIIGGDFNLITSLEENKGRFHNLDLENLGFKEIIDQISTHICSKEGAMEHMDK